MLSGTQYHLINHSQRRTLAVVPVFGHVKVSVNFKSTGLVARKGFMRARLLGCSNLLGTHLCNCYTHLSTSSYIPTQVCLNRFCVHSSPCCTLSRTASCKQNNTLLNAHHWLLNTAILRLLSLALKLLLSWLSYKWIYSHQTPLHLPKGGAEGGFLFVRWICSPGDISYISQTAHLRAALTSCCCNFCYFFLHSSVSYWHMLWHVFCYPAPGKELLPVLSSWHPSQI